MEDQIAELLSCPRCGDRGFEHLETYSHCVACLYSSEFEKDYEQVPEGALRALSATYATLNPEERMIEAEAEQGVA